MCAVHLGKRSRRPEGRDVSHVLSSGESLDWRFFARTSREAHSARPDEAPWVGGKAERAAEMNQVTRKESHGRETDRREKRRVSKTDTQEADCAQSEKPQPQQPRSRRNLAADEIKHESKMT